MSPDELRIAAEDVDNWIDPTGNAHVAAQAARNLADVIEFLEVGDCGGARRTVLGER